jgi:hypothetical protein
MMRAPLCRACRCSRTEGLTPEPASTRAPQRRRRRCVVCVCVGGVLMTPASHSMMRPHHERADRVARRVHVCVCVCVFPWVQVYAELLSQCNGQVKSRKQLEAFAEDLKVGVFVRGGVGLPACDGVSGQLLQPAPGGAGRKHTTTRRHAAACHCRALARPRAARPPSRST